MTKYTDEEVKEFEKELGLLKMEVVSKDELVCKRMAVQIDIDTEVDYSKLVNTGLILKKYTGRGDYFYVEVKLYDTEKKTLTFEVSCPVAEAVYDYYDNMVMPVGTTFQDLVWYHSEGTDELTADELNTKFRTDAIKGDLTWFMPSRMTDNFVEIMHTLNQSFLQGLMIEAIVYGVYLLPDTASR